MEEKKMRDWIIKMLGGYTSQEWREKTILNQIDWIIEDYRWETVRRLFPKIEKKISPVLRELNKLEQAIDKEK